MVSRAQARWCGRVGTLHARIDDWRRAQRWYERAVRRDPSSAQHRIALGHACERGGPWGIVIDYRAGAVYGDAGDWRAARLLYEEALQLEPSSIWARVRLGVALDRLGDGERGLRVLRDAVGLDAGATEASFELGRALMNSAAREGAFTSDQLTEQQAQWDRTLLLDPRHHRARFHLVRSYVRSSRWDFALRTAWPAWPGSLDQLARSGAANGDLLAHLANEVVARRAPFDEAPDDWFFVLHWWLVACRRFRLAHEVKKALADRVCSNNWTIEEDGIDSFLHSVQALVHSDRPKEANLQLSNVPTAPLRHIERVLLDKLRADIDIRSGNLSRHVNLGSRSPMRDELAERAFRSMIEGRRIAVVGPAGTDSAHQTDISDHDVVIRTKFTDAGDLQAPDTSRTDIAYYADTSARVHASAIRRAITDEQLRMAVFRPSALAHLDSWATTSEAVRCTPSEDLSTFRHSHFAIQRIVYDILRYEPAEVRLFGINFFLSERPYANGYTTDAESIYSARGYVRVLPTYGHDFVADFVFIQQLAATGTVTTAPEIENLLALSPTAYLEALENVLRSERP